MKRKTEITVSHADKILYPGGKFTKANVVDYYWRVASYLLPHFRDRPVTLKRYPDGVFGEAFYEKDAPGFTPDWVKTFPVPRHEEGPDINYILVNDRRTLMWAASIAALELHPFLHRVPHIERPTHIVFDLDPGEDANVLSCAEVSFLLRDVLTKLRLKCFAKVSGIERHSSVRAVEHGCHIRPDTILCARDSRIAGEKTSGQNCRGHGEESAGRQSVYRLEPERRFQDDGWRLLVARKTSPALRVDARSME